MAEQTALRIIHVVLCLLQDTALGKAVDIALGIAIPVHSHQAINSVLSDYVPKSVLGELFPDRLNESMGPEPMDGGLAARTMLWMSSQ